MAWPLPTSHHDLLSGYSYTQYPSEQSGSLLPLGLCSLNPSADNVLPHPFSFANCYSSFRTWFSSHLLQEAFSDYYKLGQYLFCLWPLLASLHPAHSGLTQLVHTLFY